MFDFIKNIIGKTPDNTDNTTETYSEQKLQIATCALFLEVANSDDEFSDTEKEFIKTTMQKEFNLSNDTLEQLMQLSEQQTRESVSLYEFTDIINKNFSRNEKLSIIKNLWRLAYADGRLDKYEEYFLRIINQNLHLEHADMIAAKLEVKKEKENKL
jgi:uncharacterized tellurite resistance protein B-like protein